MKTEQLKRGMELTKIIQTTNKALTELTCLRDKAQKKPAIAETSYQGRPNNLYNFFIAEYGDDSGVHGEINRYEGNDLLLEVIIATLENQLVNFQKEFETL